MIRTTRRTALATGLAILTGTPGLGADQTQRVTLLETPEAGIQPQAAIGSDGTIHLIYFKGDAAGGDVFYGNIKLGETQFSAPVRVNSQAGSAVAIGTIRGAQMALGPGGRVHVAWNGSDRARPANPIKGVPMLYSRSNPSRTAFDPQRNLMRRTYVLDGGGTIAAGREGKVYVGWHGRDKAARQGEQGRRFWLARSRDDGATFDLEEPTLARETGACACCGTRALADARGNFFALYRAATHDVDRDMILLTSRDGGKHFQGTVLQPWKINACPMSSASLAEGSSRIVAAWETKGQVYFSRLDPRTLEPSPPVAAPGNGDRKHPAVAVNGQGETILVWTEGTGWQRGGSLAWRVFDSSGRPTRESGRLESGVPVWGLATVVARSDGFTIIH
jgi:hypothetical protein